MFQYCFKNPVNMDDPSGHWPKLSTILTAVAVVATVVVVAAVVVATVGAAHLHLRWREERHLEVHRG